MKLGKLILGAVLVVVTAGGAEAYTTHIGTITLNHTFGTYLRGADDHGDWTGAGYGYSMPSTIGYAAGNTIYDTSNGAALDGSWIQETGGGFGSWQGQGTIWDLGFASSSVDVFPFIDHADPPETPLQEGTEFRIYGSNDLGNWFAAVWTDSWTQGYNAATIYDDYTSRWSFGASAYRYVGLVAGNPELNFNSFDAEIDAVGVARPIPEPATMLLLGGGLLGLAGARARRRWASTRSI